VSREEQFFREVYRRPKHPEGGPLVHMLHTQDGIANAPTLAKPKKTKNAYVRGDAGGRENHISRQAGRQTDRAAERQAGRAAGRAAARAAPRAGGPAYVPFTQDRTVGDGSRRRRRRRRRRRKRRWDGDETVGREYAGCVFF
jgi:hypothetical protein